MKLQKLKSAARSPRADLNVELSHITKSPYRYVERLAEEFEKAATLFENLRLDRFHFKTSISMLVDDKIIDIKDRGQWFSDISEELPDVFNQIDYVAFESDLKPYLTLLYTKLIPSQSNAVKREIERYVSKRRQTACSHDIAIWHLMRAGVLGTQNLPVYRITHKSKICSNTHIVPISFCAPRVMSILNLDDKGHEELADADILQFTDPTYFDWRLIQRCYYF